MLIGLLTNAHPVKSALVDVRPLRRISDDKVRLGDIFTGIDGHTQKIVGKSPNPGESKVYTFHELRALAKKFNLKWKPLLDSAQTQVLRASFRVDHDQLRTHVYEALHAKHPKIFPKEPHAIVLEQGTAQIFLPAEKRTAVKKSDLRMGEIKLNPQQSRFTIAVTTPYTTTTVEGHLVKQREIPVLRRTMQRGEIITPLDTELMATAVKGIGRAQIIERTNVIGKTIAVGRVRAFKPIYAHEVAWEFIVHTGDPVRLFPRLPQTHETQPGMAMMDGMRDDVILVRNENTGTIHEAHIVGESRVELLTSPPQTPSSHASKAPDDDTDARIDETTEEFSRNPETEYTETDSE